MYAAEAHTDTTPPRTMMGRRPMGTVMKVIKFNFFLLM